MAVFGFQLLLTIIVLSILNKISLKYSFARWILTKGGLHWYLHPTNDQLKDAIAQQSKSGSETNNSSSISNHHSSSTSLNHRKSRRKNRQPNDDGKPETFSVPRNLTLTLDSEYLNILNLVQLPYYSELQWLIDFSLCTVLVYFATEIYYTFLNKASILNECNLSIIWCLLSLGFVVKILCSITATYFRGEESIGERSICIVSFCVFLLISMVIMVVDEENLEFGLVYAYKNFSVNAYRLLEQQGAIQNAYGPSSFLMIKFWISVTCGFIGALFAFPGLRMAQMHFDAITYAKGNHFLTILYHVAFISPLFIVLSWVKPVSRNYLVNRNSITNETFESARLVLILMVLLLRFCLFRRYLQSYLNIAPQKFSYLKKQSGKITNIDIQKMIARVGHYLCVASLQYLSPLLLCLFLTLLTKSTGDYRWTGTLLYKSDTLDSTISVCPLNTSRQNETDHSPLIQNGTFVLNKTILDDNQTIINDTILPLSQSLMGSIKDNISEIPTTNNVSSHIDFEADAPEDVAKMALAMLRNVFNPIVLRGFIGFILWWTCTCWFSTSVVGFIYNSYFRSS